jgi:hypothetical protein
MHWIGAAAVICMFLSGWAIYSAAEIGLDEIAVPA